MKYIIALFALTVMFAQSAGADRYDRRESGHNRRVISREMSEIRRDREAIACDIRDRDYRDLRRDEERLRYDRAELRCAERELHRDSRDRHHDWR